MGIGRRRRSGTDVDEAVSALSDRRSSDRQAQTRQQRLQTYWQRTQDPQFTSDAPPAAWERFHSFGERPRTRPENRPVPRLASHDYFRLDSDPRNFYFY